MQTDNDTGGKHPAIVFADNEALGVYRRWRKHFSDGPQQSYTEAAVAAVDRRIDAITDIAD